jgi:murein DD-endopeptidase
MLLMGCASSFDREPERASVPADHSARQAVLMTALGQIGRPYRYGGADGDGFDCSGLTHHVYADVGVSLPRTAADQSRAGPRITVADAQPGDLVFFRTRAGDHVGIYVGDRRMVHAPSAGRTVSVSSLDTPYWRRHLLFAVRVLL